MKYITEETLKKIQESINNEPYFCSKIFEEKVISEMLNIVRKGDNKIFKLKKNKNNEA